MTYESVINQGVVVLRLDGDLIGENSGLEILDELNNKINAGHRYCAIDLSRIRYMNSSGIGVLITILTKFRNQGGDIILINPSDQINKLLIITKLNAIFTIMKSEEEAIKTLKSK